jgi:hypothetical protein
MVYSVDSCNLLSPWHFKDMETYTLRWNNKAFVSYLSLLQRETWINSFHFQSPKLTMFLRGPCCLSLVVCLCLRWYLFMFSSFLIFLSCLPCCFSPVLIIDLLYRAFVSAVYPLHKTRVLIFVHIWSQGGPTRPLNIVAFYAYNILCVRYI